MSETIAIFGATGGSGSEILAAALNQGYLVRIMIRNPSKLSVLSLAEHPNLTVLKGDINSLETIKETVRGADYVISAVGGPMGKPKDFPVGEIVLFIQNLVTIMKETPSVKVFLYQSGSFIAHPDGTQPISLKIMGTILGRWILALGPNLDENLNIQKYMDSVKDDLPFKTICTRPGGLQKGEGGTKLVAAEMPSFSMVDFKDLGVFTVQALKDESLYGKYPYVAKA